ncbi:hypothetical protein NP493_135g03007 [Ridgeia piscesae]|uniref:Uncharacterized protein n=1 Tax=Ridgeia piscesae TaxID=27915 RepID=A0AAD9UGA1_RIDPI|nr:hypothetical protein NP493_135g03007 [Ridgeia piscesae]
MLRRDRNQFTPAYPELPATQANLIAATSDCSLRIQYPRGVNSNTASVKCPIGNTHLSCDEDKDYDVDIEPTLPSRRPTPTPKATRAPRPPTATTTTTAAPPKGDKCGDEEATNVISEDDCGPRVNTVKSHATRTITHSLLLCFIVLMATVVIEC